MQTTPKSGHTVLASDRDALRIGTVLGTFTSATGQVVADVRLAGEHRIAVLAGDVVANLGPYGAEETTLQIGRWLRDE